MSQQMMTLPEIRALLARQSTEGLQNYNDKTGVLSIEGGKVLDNSLMPLLGESLLTFDVIKTKTFITGS